MQEKPRQLVIFTDGGARGNPGPAGAGVYVVDQVGQEVFSQHSFLGTCTNNEAEYLALELAIVWLINYLQDNGDLVGVEFNLDSKLVVEQMNRRWKIKEPRLYQLALRNLRLLDQVGVSYEINYIPREKNKRADLLANQAMDQAEKLV